MKLISGFTLAMLLCSPSIMALDLEDEAKVKETQSDIKSSFSDDVKKMMGELGDVENVRMLPIKNVMLIQLKGKPPIFISSNGRFLIEGDIKDLWSMTPVQTVKQAEDSWLLHLDTFANGTLMEQMAIIPFGNPEIKKQARVFVSPTAKESQEFLANLDPRKVNLDLIIMPHDKGSITPSMKAWCGYSTTDSLQVLITGDTDNIGQRECSEEDLKKVMTPMLMATYLDINKIPYFVRINGKRYAGLPKNPIEWLQNKPKAPANEEVEAPVEKPTVSPIVKTPSKEVIEDPIEQEMADVMADVTEQQ
jgi:thiol:disulfide interchange protein DsbC